MGPTRRVREFLWHGRLAHAFSSPRSSTGGVPMPHKWKNSHARRIRIIFGMCALLFAAEYSFAHPMGNFSINRYTAIHVEDGGLQIRYRIDLAEIPTFQELQAAKTTIAVSQLQRRPELISKAISHNGSEICTSRSTESPTQSKWSQVNC